MVLMRRFWGTVTFVYSRTKFPFLDQFFFVLRDSKFFSLIQHLIQFLRGFHVDPVTIPNFKVFGIGNDKVVHCHFHASLSRSARGKLPSSKIFKTMMDPILIFHDSIKSEVTAIFHASVELIGLNSESVWKFCSSIRDDFVPHLVRMKRVVGSFQDELLIGKQF